MTPEQEIKLLKELLYCTKRSCNNCGKVNCENFQRQRIDCCGLWVSYKDYITDLENKIADIKANCDHAIEGRDIKIMELEEENEELKRDKEDLIFVRNVKADHINELKDQLSKAKEIIREFARLEYADFTNGDYSNELSKVLEQAEQFLREIEK